MIAINGTTDIITLFNPIELKMPKYQKRLCAMKNPKNPNVISIPISGFVFDFNVLNSIRHLLEKDGIFLIVVNIKRLQFNILNHSIVPKHRTMTDSEVKTVMDKHNLLKVSEFPDINRFDPVAVAIGLRPGRVCEIIRPSKTSIEGMYYRVCV